MNFLKKLPLPIAGTALGFAALGNLLQKTNLEFLRPFFGAIAALIVLALVFKLFLLPKGVKTALENPVVASSFATFPMALMILSTYLSKGPLAVALWAVGILAHLVLLLWFTKTFLMSDFQIGKVFPSWFIVYVGMAAASVAAPYHNMKSVGLIIFWITLVLYALSLVLVLKRMSAKKPFPDPAKPTLAIFAAPASLLVAAYLSSATAKNATIATLLLCFSLFFFLVGIIGLFKTIGLPFMPSFSSFTFPLVISAIASKMSSAYFGSSNLLPWLPTVAKIQQVIALVVCLYVLLRYLLFMATPTEAK